MAFALAAQCAGVLPLAVTLSHLANVLRVADLARLRRKGYNVAIDYDRLARKDWERKSAARFPGWTVERAVSEIDTQCRDRAFEEAASAPNGSAKSTSKQTGGKSTGGSWDSKGREGWSSNSAWSADSRGYGGKR